MRTTWGGSPEGGLPRGGEVGEREGMVAYKRPKPLVCAPRLASYVSFINGEPRRAPIFPFVTRHRHHPSPVDSSRA
jgi:hypothetical protein